MRSSGERKERPSKKGEDSLCGKDSVCCSVAALRECYSRRSSRPFLLARGRLNLALQQSMRRADGFQLLKTPFQNQLAKISKCPLLLCGKRRKLVSKSLADPKADLGFPFTHPVPSCKLDRVDTQGNQWICWFPRCR